MSPAVPGHFFMSIQQILRSRVGRIMEKFILIANFKIIPGFEDEIKKATIAMAVETRKEKGCESFLIHTRNDSPQTVVFYEIYDSEEAFQQHKTFPYASSYFELFKGRIENDKPEITFLAALK
jgi:quinol monooxygenase YgiN